MQEVLMIQGYRYIREDCVPMIKVEKPVEEKKQNQALSLSETSKMWLVATDSRTSKILRELEELGEPVGFKSGKFWRVDPEKAWESFQDGTVQKVIDYLRSEGRW